MSFDLLTTAQIETLRQMAQQGEAIDFAELIAVTWREPYGVRYYTHADYENAPNFDGLKARNLPIEVRLTSGYFHSLLLTSEIEDDSMPLDLLDDDREITRLLKAQGEGCPVEVFWFFPQLDLMISAWWGHLRPPTQGGGSVLKCSASSGFRSTKLPLPRRLVHAGCAAPFGGLLKTQAEIDELGMCPYNRHLGGNVGTLDANGQPRKVCPRTSIAVCSEVIGDDGKYFLGAETVIETIYNGQSKGGALYPSSTGNESNLKDPIRVIAGERVVKGLRLYALLKQFNNKHPEDGFVRVLFEVCEGTVESISECKVNDTLLKIEHLQVRLGDIPQARTGFTPNVAMYPGTALFSGLYGQVNPAGYNQSNLQGSAKVKGFNKVKHYSSEIAYTKAYTTNRARWLLEAETNPKWGRGKKASRFEIAQDFIPLAAWCDESVRYRRSDGSINIGKRSQFHAEMLSRPTAQQIRDICLFGHIGLPFRHHGKVRYLPLRKESLVNIPVFTDSGSNRNICSGADGDSLLTWSFKSDDVLPNEILLTFEDREFNYVERTLTFGDQPAQAAAGESLGDTTLHRVTQSYKAYGITDEGEAIRIGWIILNLGEFDGGGLKNNFEVRFTVPYFEAINLYRYAPIQVISQKIDEFEFQYFRVMDRQMNDDMTIEVIAQAYPEDYYEELESFETVPPMPAGIGLPNVGGRPGARPYPIGFDDFNPRADRIDFQLSV